MDERLKRESSMCSKTGDSYRAGVCKGLCLSTLTILYILCFLHHIIFIIEILIYINIGSK